MNPHPALQDVVARKKYYFPLRNQPLKGLWVTIKFVLLMLVHLPAWTVEGSIPFLRPRRSWTLQKLLNVRYLRYLAGIGEKVGIPVRPYKDVTLYPPKFYQGLVLMRPAPDDIVQGEIRAKAQAANIKPVPIAGYWYTQGESPLSDKDTVVLYLHGGLLILGSARPSDPSARVPKLIMELALPKADTKEGAASIPLRILSVDYRRSSTAPYEESGAFPAAILDGLAGYLHLLSLGINPDNITIMGDSAGATIALGLMRYILTVNLPSLPTPRGGLVLFSPCTDLALVHTAHTPSYRRNWSSDYIGIWNMSDYGLAALLGPHNPAELATNLYLSPATFSLPAETRYFTFPARKWPRTMLVSGEAEMMLDELRTLAERLEADQVDLRYLEVKDAVHNFVMFPWFEPERTQTLQAVVDWLVEEREAIAERTTRMRSRM